MYYIIRLCLILVTLSSCNAFAAALEYSVIGLPDRLQHNALAWLGDPPETPQERSNFLVTARQRVGDSLRALGYYDADISLDVQRTEPVWTLAITVDPGEPILIRKINLELKGAAARDQQFLDLVARAPFVTGNVFSHGEYERFRNRLLTLGQELGYFDAELERHIVEVNPAGFTADIELSYASGTRYRFGEVTFDEGVIDAQLLQSLQPFAPGDYFDQASLESFQAQLQRTRYFAGVMLRPQFDQVKEQQLPLLLTLYPARRHSFDVGIGYSTDTQQRVSMIWRTPKVNRSGHSQETRIAWSVVNPSARVTYSIPLSHPLDDVLHLTGRLENNKFGDLASRQQQVGVRRELRRGKWLQGYSLRALDESWELKNTKENNYYSLPGFTLSRTDSRGSVIDPTSGFSQLYAFEVASDALGSDIDLLRVTADIRYIRTLAPRHRLVGRVQLGGAFLADSDREDLAPSLNFFAGGSQSIRGYGYQSVGNEVTVTRDDGSRQDLVVGGDRLATASLEYQYYFTDKWRGALFVDAGDAFDAGEFDLNVGPGFGIHYLSPVGAVRVEFANSVTDEDPAWRVHLNIGVEF